MNVVTFEYAARFGHFRRAEASRYLLSYPVPPRTALVGLVGAVLGLAKDDPQTVLHDAHLAVRGPVPRKHWHGTKYRHDAALTVESIAKAHAKQQQARGEQSKRLPQEWLLDPRYRVWAALPEPFHTELAARVQERRWHFTPCMGLSELLAQLSPVPAGGPTAEQLPFGLHWVSSVIRYDAGRIQIDQACAEGLALQSLRMPCAVTTDRVFRHADYWLERHERPLPVETSQAWRIGPDTVVFL